MCGEIIKSRDLGERNGFTLVAYIVPDEGDPPHEDDCYTTNEIRGFNAGEWGFVVITVVASKAGIELGRAHLGSVEHGWLSRHMINALDHEQVSHLIDEALVDANVALASLFDVC